MRLKGFFNIQKFDKKKYTKTLDGLMKASLNEATREFYRAVWPLVIVRTGMARGSLVPLGRFIKNVPISITPEVDEDRGRTLAGGIAAGQDSFEISDEVGRYVFNFSIPILGPKLDHYNINEQSAQPGVRNAPWNTLEAGKAAFKERLKEENLNAKIVKAAGGAIIATRVRIE